MDVELNARPTIITVGTQVTELVLGAFPAIIAATIGRVDARVAAEERRWRGRGQARREWGQWWRLRRGRGHARQSDLQRACSAGGEGEAVRAGEYMAGGGRGMSLPLRWRSKEAGGGGGGRWGGGAGQLHAGQKE